MVKEAIVLAGGLGTRLRKVVKDVPKPMADVNGKPFLEYLLRYLNHQGIEKVILSVGYKYKTIIDYFGEKFLNIKLVYSIENEPLGTGGGIKKSLSLVDSDEVFVLNGDTYFDISLARLFSFHSLKKAKLSIALKFLENFERYGIIEINSDNRIVGFKEKRKFKKGLINGGIYVLNKEFFLSLRLSKKFSFEYDFLEKYYNVYYFYGLELNGYFIDIGIPEDYEKFKKDISKFS